METCFNYTDRNTAYFSSDERKMVSRIRKLSEQYPEEVHIISGPEDNDGCIYCTLPADWLKIGPKRKCNLTDEQRAALADRLRHI